MFPASIGTMTFGLRRAKMLG